MLTNCPLTSRLRSSTLHFVSRLWRDVEGRLRPERRDLRPTLLCISLRSISLVGRGTTTSPTNRHPIPFTIKVRVILVSGGWFDRLTIKRRVNGFNELGGYAWHKF
jgi:hypothetical protein